MEDTSHAVGSGLLGEEARLNLYQPAAAPGALPRCRRRRRRHGGGAGGGGGGMAAVPAAAALAESERGVGGDNSAHRCSSGGT